MANTNTTKDLNRTLKKGDLMSIAVGQIIGAGVMVMSIAALGMTGRSVNIAFVVAAVLTCFGALPSIFMGSTIRVMGGFYSQAAIFVGDQFAGYYSVIQIFSSMSQAMFATGLVSYLGSLIPVISENQLVFSVIFYMAFFVLNWFGTAWMAKVQSFMFYLLIIALVMFTVFGVPKVQWAGYFGNELFGEPLFTNGISGLLEAASYLTFATGGATVIVSFSAEAVNPTKDIPVVIIASTVGVAVLYAFMSSCIGGILPASEVMAAGNLSVIAKMIMPAPCYYFFIICGACFALGTTLNSSIASAVKPLFAAAADGWFPPVFARLNKHKVPYAWLMMFAIVNVAAIVSGMNISMMGKLVLFIGNINSVFLIVGIMKLPKLFPEPWAKSPFHVSNTMLYVLLSLSLAVTLMQAYMNCQNQPTWVIVSNVVMFIFAFVYSRIMLKSGKVKVSANYELL